MHSSHANVATDCIPLRKLIITWSFALYIRRSAKRDRGRSHDTYQDDDTGWKEMDFWNWTGFAPPTIMAPFAGGRELATLVYACDHFKDIMLGQSDSERFLVRQAGSDPLQAAAGTQAQPTPDASSSSVYLYLGIGVGVGGAILIAIVALAVQIVRKRREHKRAMVDIGAGNAVPLGQVQDIVDVPRPVSIARHGTLAPLHARAGWGALSSDEAINEPQNTPRSNKKKRASILIPRRFRQRGIPMERLKHLSAIIESPRSRTTKSPSPAVPENGTAPSTTPHKDRRLHALDQLAKVDEADDVFTCPGSPKPDVLPSFAIRSPGMYGAAIANDDRPRPSRSVSVGALLVPAPDNAVLEQPSRHSRPNMHARSISLGAPLSRPPPGPVPPLPAIAPHLGPTIEDNRQGLCVSRLSSSSQDSAYSSVLLTTPILTIHGENEPVGSPSIKEAVADDESAQLKTVVNRQWQNPLITGPRPTDGQRIQYRDMDVSRTHRSVQSNVARYSTSSQTGHRLSTISIESTDSSRNRLSVPQIATADRISTSRVSSSNSIKSTSGIQKVTTPRRRQSSVSAYGSPAERKKTSVLRDISGNAGTPSRQPSNATQGSGHSSNGNPFQWDQPLPKPSALKGSPNARKGHRRQNCVRISTLVPQVLGPPPSRSTSPSVMHRIEEECADGEASAYLQAGGLRFVRNPQLSRPTSASNLANNLRAQTLRASLTPSSPTLSAWNAYHEHGLPSQASDTQLSVSPATRTVSRQSARSSTFSIPSFPSPSKPTVSGVQMQQPVPEFCLSRPSTDQMEEDDLSSPFGLDFSPDHEMPSSPPLPVSKSQVYDPAWPAIIIPAPVARQEYDPASPAWDGTEPERSSPFFAFATPAATNDASSTQATAASQPHSCNNILPDTPPCSPKTMPDGLPGLFDTQESGSHSSSNAEKLTSANASAIMASMATATIDRAVDFPGAPVLAPPCDSEVHKTPWFQTERAVSTASDSLATRPTVPLSTPSFDDCVPSPLSLKVAPLGPRSEPAKSVLKNAMALRRMNSEVDYDRNRESRRYTRLGREASPLLPWIGTLGPGESCNDLFDFGFDNGAPGAGSGADAEGGAEEHMHETSALDDIDFSALDRRLDGALAGFDAEPSPAVSRSSSVWEDGEKFWDRQPHFSFTPKHPSYIDTTPTKKDLPVLDRLATPVAKLHAPLPQSSIGKTPKSLYDSDGFLRT